MKTRIMPRFLFSWFSIMSGVIAVLIVLLSVLLVGTELNWHVARVMFIVVLIMLLVSWRREGVLEAQLDGAEDYVRVTAHTDRSLKYPLTDSMAKSSVASEMRFLAQHGRLRIKAEYGRRILGYWPENDPENDPENA